MTAPQDVSGLAAPSGAGRRRSELRRARRRRRRQAVVAVLAVGALLAVLVTAYFARRDEPLPTAGTPSPGRTQSTLLVQVAAAGGDAAGSVLLAHDPAAAAGAGLLVPPQVLATAPGSRPLPYASVLGALGPDASRKALADLLGVTVDAAWVLDAATAVRLVDGLGGIRVDVDVPVLAAPSPGAAATVLLQPGEQPVDGTRALAFATYRAVEEQEQVRLARLQELVDGVLAALPDDARQVAGLLDTLGAGSQPFGTDVPGLAGTLVGLSQDLRATALQYDTVPVVTVDTGGVPAARLDADAARGLVERLLSASVPAGQRADGNRVLVYNGVGTPFLGDRVRDALLAAGLRYVPGGNATTFGVATTEVQVPDATPTSLQLGARVAAALGVPPSSVRIGSPTSVADVVVVVGADFVPPVASSSPAVLPPAPVAS